MRTVTCHSCGLTEPLNEFGLPPLGWIVLQRYQLKYTAPIDACTPTCAVKILAELLPDAHLA